MRLYVSAALMLCLAGCGDYGTGEKVGTIIKLSRQGVFCNTWEAEMVRGGMNNGSGSFAVAPFDFTIEDASLIPKVQQAFNNQTEVKITYHSEINSFCRSDGSSHFLVKIEPMRSVSIAPKQSITDEDRRRQMIESQIEILKQQLDHNPQ